MDPPKKRIKLVPVKLVKLIKLEDEIRVKRKRKLRFINLNAKCVGDIFQYLSLEDLYSISCTCKSMQKMAGIQFQRDYSNHSITIELTQNDAIQILCEGNYDLHFSSSIQNVTVTSYIFERDPLPLFNYMKSNCCPKLKEIQLTRLNLKENFDYGALIKGQLRNLDSIAFNRCTIDDIHKQLLKYCMHLKHLRIKENGSDKNSCAPWKRRPYRELENLTFWGSNENSYNELCIFFSLNLHVKNVNCMNVKVIESVLKHATNLEHIVIHCEKPEQLDEITNLLGLRSERFQRFELVFQYTYDLSEIPGNVKCIERLSLLPAFQGFHGLHDLNEMLVRTVLLPLSNLRTLSLKLKLDDELLVWQLVQQFSQLECFRMYICMSTKCFGMTFKTLALPFMMTSKNLKQMIVSFSGGSNVTQQNDLVDLNEARSKLNGACACTIYMDSGDIETAQFIIPAKGFIQLKPNTQLKRHIYLDPFLF